MSRPHPALVRLAQGLIAAGVLLGVLAFAARAADTRDVALRALEGGALLFAAAAYLAHLASHRPSLRELVLRSGLVLRLRCGRLCNSRQASAALRS